MATSRRLHTYLAWLALCAMCFGAVAPTVSKWLAATESLTWSDICGENGPVQLAAADVSSKAPQSPTMVGDYCPYCALVHHLPFVPPGAGGLVLPPAAAPPLQAAATFEFHLPSPERRAHAPRAPPALA